MKNSLGFTLIELMIVVAIIAILAAIAIPFFNDYAARAQMTEAYTLAAGLKTPVSEAYANDAAGACALPSSAVTTGKYVGSLTVAPVGAACVVTAKISNVGANNRAAGKMVQLTYDPATLGWTCATDVVAALKPLACQ